MSRRTEKFWEHFRRVVNLPIKLAVGATGFYGTISAWLTPVEDRSIPLSVVAGLTAVSIAAVMIPISEIKKFRTSLPIVGRRLVHHFNNHKAGYALVSAASLVVSVSLCVGFLAGADSRARQQLAAATGH